MTRSATAPVEIAPGVFRVASQLGVRRIAQWLVLGDDGVLVIDTGVDGTVGEHLVPALRTLGRAPSEIVEVVISHADVDHYGGNGEIRRLAPEASIRCGVPDRELIGSWARIGRERYGWYEQHGLAYDPDTLGWLEQAGGPDTAVDGVLCEGDVLDVGGTPLRVLELPGHSAGHLGFLIADTACAIVVDAVLERGLYDVDDVLISPPPYVTASGYRASIAKLQDLNLAQLETAHYPEVRGDAVAAFLADSAAFTDDLERIVRRELAAGPQTIAQITAVADSALGPFSAMALELGRSVGTHVDELAAGGEARRVEADGGCPTWTAADET
jgi:glyoxylase-like metal-dependent hydrolase (beta-lactamase superfamily II)